MARITEKHVWWTPDKQDFRLGVYPVREAFGTWEKNGDRPRSWGCILAFTRCRRLGSEHSKARRQKLSPRDDEPSGSIPPQRSTNKGTTTAIFHETLLTFDLVKLWNTIYFILLHCLSIIFNVENLFYLSF